MQVQNYKGKALSRGELAARYGITTEMFNDWLKEIDSKLSLQRRRVLKPKEINIIFEEWGMPD